MQYAELMALRREIDQHEMWLLVGERKPSTCGVRFRFFEERQKSDYERFTDACDSARRACDAAIDYILDSASDGGSNA